MMSPVSPDDFQPLQLKGEILDLDFSIDTDHRKRRRNRTTQSCLNCHTSKRKCDRKRPCQRCIQLGLTGLCVYEIDDPALRDDPSVDESTRLRNRIAELESLVRELRGKPHPRWAESSFRDGDPNEKWHSRATKCAPLPKSRAAANGSPHTGTTSPGVNGQQQQQQQQQGEEGRGGGGRSAHPLLSPIKTEPLPDGGAGSHLYRFSPSPAPQLRGYHGAQQHSHFDAERAAYAGGSQGGGMPYSGGGGASVYSDGGASSGGGGAYGAPNGVNAGSDYGGSPHMHYSCPCSCRTAPALGVAYMGLSQTLQSALGALRQFGPHHAPGAPPCLVYRKVVELNNALHSGTDSPGLVSAAYDSGPPSDNEIMTPLSASSGHASFHTGSPGVSPQEWGHMAAAGFNPYFPAPEHHGVYAVSHVMS